ncbi:5-formyltetrahydrofolate cyclo-ligase [Arenimonas fontis]|uniref:5-formyltetrahydrofolate cyclo-ligase n=1 Tax=Arenimonas fontis TaxID=2608255 RepID=UPI001FE48066|nr:5-formyltetrahydrofolate cyclo-ligase [Arenimonas fontis]
MSAARRQLRQAFRRRRAALGPGERLEAAAEVARHLGERPELRQPGHVGGYWAIGGELPLHAVQLRLPPGQVWCLPTVQDDGGLRFAPWRPGDPLRPNRFGIPEPVLEPASTLAAADLAWVLVPLLAFDPAGYRLGMGAGYYDRAFAFRLERSAPPLLIGVGYDWQALEEPLEAEPWDVPLDAVCTQRGFRRFGR